MDDQLELSLYDLFQLLRRGLIFALSVAIGAAALTFFLSNRLTPEYDSTTTLLLSRPSVGPQGNFGVSRVKGSGVEAVRLNRRGGFLP